MPTVTEHGLRSLSRADRSNEEQKDYALELILWLGMIGFLAIVVLMAG